MTRVAVRFRDPSAALATYDFAVNPSDEEAREQNRQINRTAPTSGVGFVRQQGDRSPDTRKFSGTILTTVQLNAMQSYYLACDTRTVFFRDVDGVEYEVLITSFQPQRVRVLRNPREDLLWIWKYRLEMEVIA